MGKCQQKSVWLFVHAMSVSTPPNQALPLVQSGVQSDYLIKTKYLGEISIEKCVAFCPYRIDGRFPGIDKILLACAPHNIPSEMSMEESLGAIPITLLFNSFCVYHLFSNC
jgi:hypothetical protein